MKKALVTGAAGFIGSNVVRELLQEGVEIRALIKAGENLRNLQGLDVEQVQGDVLDPDSLRRALRGCDTLFHLAAIYKFWTPEPRQIYEVNIRGSNYMLMAARDAGVEKIVYTSSIAALGIEEGRKSGTEETPFNGFRYKIDYILSKYISEMNALDMARFGMPIVVVNPAVPLGPGDITPTPSGKLVVDVVNGKFPGYIDAGIMVGDVRDVARGHVLAARKGRIGEKYVLGRENLLFKELADRVAQMAGVKIRLVKLPKATMFAYGWFAEHMSDRLTHKEPVITYAGARFSSRFAFYESKKAQEELGVTFRPLDETIQDSIAWFRELGMIQ